MGILWIIAIGTIGCIFYALSKKRKFERLNEFGEERFTSYWSKVKETLLDELLHFSGLGLIALSITTFAFTYAEDWAWLFMLMVGAFAFEDLFYRDRRKMNRAKIIR
jgi:predicted membrane channel-forming protein YqfA (hemolysin III family)